MYIMKFNSTGSALDYATLAGGKYDEAVLLNRSADLALA